MKYKNLVHTRTETELSSTETQAHLKEQLKPLGLAVNTKKSL